MQLNPYRAAITGTVLGLACTAVLACGSDRTATGPRPTPVIPPLYDRLIFDAASYSCAACTGIWTSDTSGHDVQQLVSINGYPQDVSVSPDGRTVLFTSWGSIYLVNADGTNLRPLVTGASQTQSFSPCWSPDGQWVYYEWADVPGLPGNIAFIYRMHPDGTGRERVTGVTTRWERQPAISNDGRYLAFIASDPNTATRWIVVRDLAADTEAVVSDTGFTGFDPVWSPDASGLIFLDTDSLGANWQLDRLDLATHHYGFFANSEGNRVAHYSPDGRRLALGVGSIWVADSNGTGARRIVDDSLSYADANWTPAAPH